MCGIVVISNKAELEICKSLTCALCQDPDPNSAFTQHSRETGKGTCIKSRVLRNLRPPMRHSHLYAGPFAGLGNSCPFVPCQHVLCFHNFTPSIATMTLKSVLITGCSAGGIGFALVEAFQKRNFHVFATARDSSKMSQLDKTSNVTLLSLDPTSTNSVQTAVESVRAHTGGTLDYLINNAGQTIIMPTLDFDIETARKMYDINVWGMVRVTQEFAPLLIAAKGTLVSISSISTSVITPWMGESPKALVCFFAR